MGLFSFLFRRRKKAKSISKKHARRGDSPTQPEDAVLANTTTTAQRDETLILPNGSPVSPKATVDLASSPRSNGPVDLDDEVSGGESTTSTVSADRPVFRLSEDLRFSAGRMKDDEEDEDDGESSSFNLSTDAEDMEYESMRRRLGQSPALPTNAMLDSVSLATEEDRSVFPNLPSEDEFTANSATKDAISNSLLNPKTGASLVPEHREFTTPLPPKEFTTTKPLSTTKPLKQETSNETFVSPKAFGEFAADPAFGEGFEFPFSSPSSSKQLKKLALSTKDAPESRRRKAYHEVSPSKQDPAGQQIDPFGGWATFGEQQHNTKTVTSPLGAAKPVVSVANETKLEELLAQAKSKSRAGKASTSINSAPALSASYLRQQHGLRNSKETTSVTDIISSLEAANASRPSRSSSHSLSGRHVRTPSDGGASTRSRRRSHSRQRHHNFNSDSEEEPEAAANQDQENWLFDEVTGALGPRGITADLESLSGRSNRSGRSGKSARSGKSGRSHRRHRSGNDSVDSRRSRYSTKSYISQMSEQSRSVAADLLRLERQLAMVGANERPHRPVSRRSRITVTAPAGKLGIILANKADAKGTVVSGVRTSSALADQIAPGDRIVAIDGEDVSLMTVSEITSIMARKNEYERSLTVLTTPRA